MGGSSFLPKQHTVVCALALALPMAWWSQDRPDDAANSKDATDYTLQELRMYDGSGGDGSLLLSILGRVFNVSEGNEFYASGNGYHVFTGHDCSRNMALTSTKAKHLDKDLSDITEERLARLNETYWETFMAKYPIVGRLADPPYDAPAYDHFAGPYARIERRNVVTSGVFATTKPKRQSKCPVTRAARAMRDAVVSMLPRGLLS